MMDCKATGDDVERGVGKWQSGCIAVVPRDVTDAVLLLQLACAGEHGRRGVDSFGVLDGARVGEHDQSGAAGDIQRSVCRARLREGNELVDGSLIANAGRFAERYRLASELIEDEVAMLHGGHCHGPPLVSILRSRTETIAQWTLRIPT